MRSQAQARFGRRSRGPVPEPGVNRAPGELREVLEKLKGPFRLEERSRFRDEAVVGGFGHFVVRWAQFGAAAAGRGAAGKSFRLLAKLVTGYRETEPEERRGLIERGKELLARLDAQLAGDVGRVARSVPRFGPSAGAAALAKDIQYLKGVGPRRAAVLARLALKTVGELLYHFPRRYEDRSLIRPIAAASEGETATVEGRVVGVSARRIRKGLHILKVTAADETGRISGVWFNQPYLEKEFRPGSRIIMTGRVDTYGGKQITGPAYEILSGDEEDLIHTGRLVPVYALTEGLSERWFRSLMKRTVDEYASGAADVLPAAIRDRLDFVTAAQALKAIHFPDTELERQKAYRRLAFDEFLLLQLVIGRRRAGRKAPARKRSPGAGRKLFESLVRSLGFVLTGDQSKAVEEIRRDMASDRPMNRLIQGEVGSGKTLVAAAAILVAHEHSEQSALMAPTAILAEQHFLTLQRMLVPLGLTVNILIGGGDSRSRDRARGEAADGRADVTVGTHALLAEAVSFRKLGLVIVDEQHRFGVTERQSLREKGGQQCDLVILTATPIPRTLALTVFGDLDVSTIRELPAGRGTLSTYLVPIERREAVYHFACGEMRKGRQAFCIAPLIEGDPDEPAAATSLFKELSEGFFRSYPTGLVHGRLEAGGKERVMEDFRNGRLKALVATNVVEVGIDIANATVIIVENAERFGLAQLHQLRGRVGRGAHPSYCILLGSPRTEAARRRLEVMTGTSDGFRIAEEDLALRGPGEFIGVRQHGLFDVAIGDVLSDIDLMEVARNEVRWVLERDPELSQPENELLRKALSARWGRKATRAPGD